MRVGLTGGIGSGKSEVARLLAERGAVVIDADVVARQIVEPHSEGLAAVLAEFGETILRPDGSLDRERLGAIVFADEERRKALNAITHPRIAERTQELFAQAGEDAIVVHDVPLLTENGLAPLYDLVVVVDVPEEVQLRRLVTQRGMTESGAKARIAAQATRDERRAIADVVIDNSGSIERLDPQIDALWSEHLAAKGTAQS